MDLRSEKGFTGIDAIIAVIVLFILVSIITTLSYNFNMSSKEIERRSEALNIAVNEIEQVKSSGFESLSAFVCANEETGKDGYYKTITVIDYAEMEGNTDKQKDVVKKATVTITYKFKNQDQKVELSTILSKEN